MKNEITNPNVPTVQQFLTAFNERLKGLADSCKELALMVEADQSVFDKIVEADPRFNYNMLESMRRVGIGELYVELLFDPSMAARKLLPLPRKEQERLYNEPVKIVKLVDGKNVIEEKMLNACSRHEINLVVDENKRRARTVEEQIAYVRPAPLARRAERYQIVGDRLKVLAATEFTAAQLQSIIDRMASMSIKTLAPTMKKNQIKA